MITFGEKLIGQNNHSKEISSPSRIILSSVRRMFVRKLSLNILTKLVFTGKFYSQSDI